MADPLHWEYYMEIQSALRKLRANMDDYIIGHHPVKEALLLALIGREHLYVEGEPGCAKTLLAEVTSMSAELDYYFYQMHRDTRLNELVGHAVLQRSALPGGPGEVIQQSLKPGGVLTAEVAVLDDICRAPGEALNVLLRILNERQYQDLHVNLMTAIATSNPTADEYYNEPLDPANLDRFTLQLRTKGSVAEQNWEQARQIMDRYEGLPADTSNSESMDNANALHAAYTAHREVKLPRKVSEAYVRVLNSLLTRHGCTPANSLLTDRTMLVKAPAMIKALALLEGRTTAMPQDLRVLKYILTFRVPEEVYDNLDEIIDTVLDEMEQEEQEQDEQQQDQQVQGNEEQEEMSAGTEETSDENEGDEAVAQEILDSLQSESMETDNKQSMQQQAPGGDHSDRVNRSTLQPVENMDMLLEKIRGRLERNPAEQEDHPGGSPRAWKRMRSFEEILDTDHGDTAIWLDQMNPTLPRTYHRKKKHMGGKVVIVRDVSQSMEGRYARWTSSVVTKLVELVRRKRMRIGYIEFNHVSHKYQHDGRFFTRDYEKISEIAGNVTCSGVTNYQYPLKDALEELRKGRLENKHILFLTDGEPTQGDWLVREERKMAQQMGISIHTLFIGTTECPEILDILSEETDGFRFLATPNDLGGLEIADRAPRRGSPSRPAMTPSGSPDPRATIGNLPLAKPVTGGKPSTR